jgi:hypothetical protein
MITRNNMACLGAATIPVRTTEYMERCRACGTEVQYQLVNHPFFGFQAGCDRHEGRAIGPLGVVLGLRQALSRIAEEETT